MSNFEEYLVSIGYVADHNLYLSTLDKIQRIYTKEGSDNTFYWGFNEFGKPETLCYPRPLIVSKDGVGVMTIKQDGLTSLISGYNKGKDVSQFDDAMNRVLVKFTPEFIFDAIINNKTIHI